MERSRLSLSQVSAVSTVRVVRSRAELADVKSDSSLTVDSAAFDMRRVFCRLS